MLPIPFAGSPSSDNPPKTRSRRGCLTCRSRRLKCDERAPCCKNCAADERTCKWGLKASFHASRMQCLSKSESAFILSLEAKQRRPADLKFVDNTEEIASEYHTYGHGIEDLAGSRVADEPTVFSSEPLHQSGLESHPGTTGSISNAFVPRSNERPVSYSGAFVHADGAIGSWDHTRSTSIPPHEQDSGAEASFSLLDQASCSTDQPSIETSPATIETGQSCQTYKNDRMPRWPISQRSKARLIAAYLKETATWCETTDTARHFSLQSAHTIVASQALSAAAVAVASRQLDNVSGKARVETLELYDFARETLCSLEAWENDEVILASVVQLCVYCMMSMEVNEWRLHLRGCAGTFQEMGWSGSSSGLPSACFWAFARIDIWAAYLTQQTTLIPTDFWIRSDYVEVDSSALQDKYANKAIWLFARIVNQLFKNGDKGRDGQFSPSEPSMREVVELWKELDSWYENRPSCVQPVIEAEPYKTEAFPFILFGNQSAICGNIFYHTGCILLLETGVQKLNLPGSSHIKMSYLDLNPLTVRQFKPSWHARYIGGISITTEDHANWVNNLQPVFIAARYYDEPAEKIATLKHLKDIEVATGWKTGARSAELRGLWGLG